MVGSDGAAIQALAPLAISKRPPGRRVVHLHLSSHGATMAAPLAKPVREVLAVGLICAAETQATSLDRVSMIHCPCGARVLEKRPAFTKGETDFLVCGECGLLFRERYPTSAELEALYRDAYAQDRIDAGTTNQESGAYAAQAYADFVAGTLWESGMKVLDFGAGSGALVERLRRTGIDAEGLEFSADARRSCLSRRGFELQGSIEMVSDGQFQLVSMIEVVEHLTDIQAVLRQLWRIMSPGATLFVTTPNRRSLRALLDGGQWREARKKFHVVLFDSASLRVQLEAAGFRHVRRVRFSPVQRPGFKFWLAVRGMQLLGVGGTLCVIATRP